MISLLYAHLPERFRRLLDPIGSRHNLGPIANRIRARLNLREGVISRALASTRWDRMAQRMDRSEADRWRTYGEGLTLTTLGELENEVDRLDLLVRMLLTDRLTKLGFHPTLHLNGGSVDVWLNRAWFVDVVPPLGRCLMVCDDPDPSPWGQDWRLEALCSDPESRPEEIQKQGDITLISPENETAFILSTSHEVPPRKLTRR